jgi:hypothetical protein
MAEVVSKVIAQGKQVASHVLEAAAADIEFADGRFIIAAPTTSIGVLELAAALRAGIDPPDDSPKTLDVGSPAKPCRPLSRTAATWQRSRSIRRPVSSRW